MKSMVQTSTQAADEAQLIRNRFPFEPEREEDGSLIIDRILGRRPIKGAAKRFVVHDEGGVEEVNAMETKFEYEFLIKFKNSSLLHVQWLSGNDVEAMNQKSKKSLNRYLTKIDRSEPVQEDGEIDPLNLEVEKVLDMRDEEVNEVVDCVEAASAAAAAAAADDVTASTQEEDGGRPATRNRGVRSTAAAAIGAAEAERTRGGDGVRGDLDSASESGDTSQTKRLDADPNGDDDGDDSERGRGGDEYTQGSERRLTRKERSLLGRVDEEGNPLSTNKIWNPQERIAKVVQRIKEDPYSQPFHEAVDTDLFEDYLQVVEEPICLADVEERLASRTYKWNNFMKALHDMRRIWQNCKVYNLYKSQIWYCAHYLSILTERLFQAWVMSYQDGAYTLLESQGCPWEAECRTCCKAENDDRVILCDHCDAQFHIYCLRPKLAKIPEGIWICSRCTKWMTSSGAKPLSASAEDEIKQIIEGAGQRKIVRVKKRKYLVKWRGLSYRDCTWETKEDIGDDQPVQLYHKLNDSPPEEPPLTQAEIGLELAKERKGMSTFFPAFMQTSLVEDALAATYSQIRAYHFLKCGKAPPDALLRECGPSSYAYTQGSVVNMCLPAYVRDAIHNQSLAAPVALASNAIGEGAQSGNDDEDQDRAAMSQADSNLDSNLAGATTAEARSSPKSTLESPSAKSARSFGAEDESAAAATDTGVGVSDDKTDKTDSNGISTPVKAERLVVGTPVNSPTANDTSIKAADADADVEADSNSVAADKTMNWHYPEPVCDSVRAEVLDCMGALLYDVARGQDGAPGAYYASFFPSFLLSFFPSFLLFYSTLFYFILFYSILFYSIRFCFSLRGSL
jgi:hypothetical protein